MSKKMYSKKHVRRIMKRQKDIIENSLKYSTMRRNVSQIETKSNDSWKDKVSAASGSNNVTAPSSMRCEALGAVSTSNKQTAQTPVNPGVNAVDTLEVNSTQLRDFQERYIRRQFQLLSEKMDTTFKAQLEMVEKKVAKMEEKVLLQNTMILEFLAKQKVHLTQEKKNELNNNSGIIDMFPISTEKKLQDVNLAITDESKKGFLSVLCRFMVNGVPKAIKNILSDQLIRDYNVDGTHGKKRLKDVTNFYGLLKTAIEHFPSQEGTSESQLRKALEFNKKKQYKTTFIEKNQLKRQQLREKDAIQQEQQNQEEQQPQKQSNVQQQLQSNVQQQQSNVQQQIFPYLENYMEEDPLRIDEFLDL